MELVQTLRPLWNRRRLVGVGALIAAIAAILSVYEVGIFPPSLTSRTNVFATASTQLLVDTPASSFADTANDIEPLDARAGVFARFLASPVAVALIAREAKLPAEAIEAQGPFELDAPEIQQGPTADRRSSQIVGEGAVYRLRFENNPALPIVTIFAQAPNEDAAVKLATAVPAALRTYIDRIQAEQQIPAERRVVIRALGKATGGVVNQGANLQIATLVFVVVLGVWCMMLIPAQTIARGWREIGGSSGDPNGNGSNGARNGHGSGKDVLRVGRERQRTR